MANLDITPTHNLKPKLEWVGRVLGMDLYVDTSGRRQPSEKRDLVEAVLKAMFTPKGDE